ncbi:DUF4350 domain-containing protein [Arthrobacter sp. STN4]|uniref:DUF4350 domain-containing protein n=1 Tax=Arthrobacter sp. STN4 TaxID=2923276 RepID=UPI00211A63D1|nr:DUF4350 domain-containing protein [Arthrobacter sp. STN4]MCQ9163057.1 DUF4350 domain-containing protein [Arthrobacter sp. STN4]
MNAPVRTSGGAAAAEAGVFRAGGGTGPERAGAWWRKHGLWVVAGAALAAVTVAGLLAASLGGRSTQPLSITNPAPDGAQAAASVLRGQGVTVTATDSLESTLKALSANGTGATTVLVYDPMSLLQPGQAARLAGSAQKSGAALVALAPGPLAVQKLSPEISAAGTAPAAAAGSPVAAGCSNPDAVAAGALDVRGVDGIGAAGNPSPLLYRGAVTCFAPAGGTAGFMAADSSGGVTVVGTPAVVSNERLASQGNAALAFRLLGSRPHLLWYTASLKDVPAASHPPTLAELTPRWIFPASAWLLLVAVIGMLWRGRRHGPLVAEPLPVVVKASETVAGRARMYQDAHAQDTAAAALQRATLTRLAQRLRLGSNADPSAVVEAAAAHTGRPEQQLEALLLTDIPFNDKQLLTMAAQLTALEEEVAPR